MAIEVCTDLTERRRKIAGSFNRKANIKHVQSDLLERYEKYSSASFGKFYLQLAKQVQRDGSQYMIWVWSDREKVERTLMSILPILFHADVHVYRSLLDPA